MAETSPVLSIEEVLKQEAEAIHGATTAAPAQNQEAQESRNKFDGDKRGAVVRAAAAVQRRDGFYLALNKLNQSALCCSGGGIRSATFCLGVIQALASHTVGKQGLHAQPAPAQPSEALTSAHAPGSDAQSTPSTGQAVDATNSILGRFHYLSTVSGGGYIGSWLSSWRHRSDFVSIIDALTGRPNGSDIEPPELSWLRAYSNYLTPRLGLTSADSWTAVAISVRNLILNWLVIVPVICVALLLLKVLTTASVLVAHTVTDDAIMIGVALAGALLLILAQRFTNSRRPSRRDPDSKATEMNFVRGDLILAFASAVLVTLFFSSRYFWTASGAYLDANQSGIDPRLTWLLLTAVAGILLYAVGWIAALRFNKGWVDFSCWAVCGAVYGAIVGFGAFLFHSLTPYEATTDNIYCLFVSIILGVPWVMMAQLVAEIIFVGLISDDNNIGSDPDREWLGRAAGWLAAGAVAWAVLAFLVFAGGTLIQYAVEWSHTTLVKFGGVTGALSGLVTAWLGSSAKTPARPSRNRQSDALAIACNVGLAIAGPVFAATLIMGLSALLDQLLFADALPFKLQAIKDGAAVVPILIWLIVGLAVSAVVAAIASHFVNVNCFSLHALYRNRLIRCYLGASNDRRNPDLFSGFDFDDNVCVAQLWPPQQGNGANSYSLFHVVNIALNVISSKRLAWQERKAESFTVTPLHCGSAYVGFRRSIAYGGAGGVSLGTAMAISGAAVSPDMGYHSSPSISLLLTLFNVRLGWWLGNPGTAGEKTYQKDGPGFAALPLFSEAFGFATDDSRYVYLSDGGHFENLGLYEMVRRRCRFIVVIDAGCDPDFAFEDLGNAVRKISIDLGINIIFNDLSRLKNHPSGKDMRRTVHGAAAAAAPKNANASDAPDRIPYHAVGTIRYKDADPSQRAENGYILYIKPAVHGTEQSAGVRGYAKSHPDFPHETTADQWFTESQFESYRSLGFEIADAILRSDVVLDTAPANLTLADVLRTLKVKTTL